MSNEAIFLSYGNETEEVVQAILNEYSDDEMDGIAVERVPQTLTDLASEPITVTALIAGTISLVSICATISRHLENRRQNSSAEFVIRAFTHSPEAGEAMVALQKKYADLIKYSPLPEFPKLDGLVKSKK